MSKPSLNQYTVPCLILRLYRLDSAITVVLSTYVSLVAVSATGDVSGS